MTHFVRLSVSMLAMLLLTGCLSAGKPPTVVVKAFYTAANEGRYAEAEKFLSGKTLKEIKEGLGSREQGLKLLLDGETKDRTIDRIDFLSEQIDGDGATVNFKILYADGQTRNGRQILVKETGEWKVTFLLG